MTEPPAPSAKRLRTPLELLDRLQASQLLADSLFRRLLAAFEKQPSRSAQELAQKLIRDKAITHWQAQQLLQGQGKLYVSGLKILEPLPSANASCDYAVEQLETQRLARLSLIEGRDRPLIVATSPLVAWWLRTTQRALVPCYHVAQAASESSLISVLTGYEDGPNCADWMLRHRPFTTAEACQFVSQLAALVVARQPPVLQRPLQLGELYVNEEGHIRWSGVVAELTNAAHLNERPVEIPWGRQLIQLFLALTGKPAQGHAASNEFYAAAMNTLTAESGPGSHVFCKLLQSDRLDEVAAELLPYATTLRISLEACPFHLRRRALTVHLRRSPDWRTQPLPCLSLSELLNSSPSAEAPLLPESEPRETEPLELDDLSDLSDHGTMITEGHPARSHWRWLPPVTTLLVLIAANGVVWWFQLAKSLQATTDHPPVPASPMSETQLSDKLPPRHNPLNEQQLTPQ